MTHLEYTPLVFDPWQSFLVTAKKCFSKIFQNIHVLIFPQVCQNPVDNVVAVITMEIEGKETILFI